ncbi:MAG TPA: hypothetical protein VIM73_00805 [Polyangiaceae bacterium]
MYRPSKAFSHRGIPHLGVLGTATLAGSLALWSCGGGPFDSCEARRSCPIESGDMAGSGGAGGDASIDPTASGTTGEGGGESSGSGGDAGADGSSGAGGTPNTSGGAAADGGSGGSGAEGGDHSEDPCDLLGSPRTETCLLTEEFAVFVAPSGNDDAEGTRAAPVRTLARAVSLATSSDRVMVACAGRFNETLMLEHGLRVYGGFVCPDDDAAEGSSAWTPAADEKTIVAPAEGYALDIQSVQAPVVIQDIEFERRDAPPDASSVTARVLSSADVQLERVILRAGAGGSAMRPQPSEFMFPELESLAGNNGSASSGGATKRCVCPDGQTTEGGRGGDAQESGGTGLPIHGKSGEGEGGTPFGDRCHHGTDGLDGPFGADAPPLSILGTLLDGSWIPANGAVGGNGVPGQGGGGGSGAWERTGGGGGSGACGGCGGKGGPGGAGGGASIALLSVKSAVVLRHSVLITARGGDGAPGGAGQGSQSGGEGGHGYLSGSTPYEDGCLGGRGGNGGPGGGGGGGAGGISVGIVFQGKEPERITTAIILGSAGKGGLGFATNPVSAPDGIVTNVLHVP